MSSEVTQEIRIALFGQSGSGQTTFLASYYGNQQRNSFETTKGYSLEADDISIGNQLLSKYYKMEDGSFPLGTQDFSEFKFNLKITGIPKPGLQVVWYDYPGGWWEKSSSDESEEEIRKQALKKILTCHIGIIMLDGGKYIKNGASYIRTLFDSFKNEIRRLKESIGSVSLNEELTLPNQWMIVISKADLLPIEKTAQIIGREIIKDATDQLKGIAGVVGSKNFSHQFLLISSASAEGSKVVDAHKFIGLQLVAPLSLTSL